MTELPLLSLLAGAFAGSALCAYVATPVVARLAERIGSVDHPGGRHAHLRPTPRLGGLAVMGALALGAAIFAAFLAVTGGLESVVATLWRDELVAFVLPCALVFVVGFVDDVRGLSPSTKLVVEAVAASFLIQRGFVIDVVANPVGQPIELGIFAFPVTLLWFVGITNAHNLVDGLDGLLGSIAVTALAGCAVVAVLGDRVASAT
ncbi:MAG: hypothetical protein KIT58_24825, partial [Planctomycetota bacterium]|nr:hypothetical protein [Planctomycetota bacterium]